MYQPNPRPSSLPKEQETRNMVAFITDLKEIADGLRALDLARAEAEQAETEAKEAHKQADLQLIEVGKKQKEVDELIIKFTELKKEIDRKLEVNKEIEESFRKREIELNTWKVKAEEKEKEYHSLFNAAIIKTLELDGREKALAEKEIKLAKKLEILNG